jgi:nicotinate-nucleotide adenylyltransferase
MEKIGLYGGTFDPVHNGHIQLAQAAINEAGLNRVLMIPAVVPPHKNDPSITPYKHRVEMVRLGLANHSDIELSLIESELPTPSYTIDTINLLKTRLPVRSDLYFIIGIDAFLEIVSWKSYNQLLTDISFLVAMRHGFDHQLLDGVRNVLSYIDDGGGVWVHPDSQKDITFLSSSIVGVSSSELRSRLKDTGEVTDGIQDSVMQYIHANGLYESRHMD